MSAGSFDDLVIDAAKVAYKVSKIRRIDFSNSRNNEEILDAISDASRDIAKLSAGLIVVVKLRLGKPGMNRLFEQMKVNDNLKAVRFKTFSNKREINNIAVQVSAGAGVSFAVDELIDQLGDSRTLGRFLEIPFDVLTTLQDTPIFLDAYDEIRLRSQDVREWLDFFEGDDSDSWRKSQRSPTQGWGGYQTWIT